jgi:hypothetical protein
MTRKISYLFVILYLSSCSVGTLENKNHSGDWTVIQSTKSIKVNEKLNFSLKKIDSFAYSFSGRWFFVNDRIILFDNLYKLVTIFDLSGMLLNQYSGINVSELQNMWSRPYSILPFDSGYASIFGRSIAYLDSTFRVKKISDIYFEGSLNNLSMLEIPDSENMNIYELNERNRNYFFTSNKEILVSLESEAPLFNAYNSISYYNTAKSFGKINLKKKNLTPVPIEKSRLYKDTCCLTFQDGAFVTGNDKMYFVQFAADTLIYLYNQKFEKQYAFGVAGNFIFNKVINNGLEVAFDYDKYLNIEQRANVFEGIFYLNDGHIGRIINNRTEKKKWVQLYKGNQLDREFEIPQKFSFIGVNENKIYFIYENELLKNIELCIVR